MDWTALLFMSAALLPVSVNTNGETHDNHCAQIRLAGNPKTLTQALPHVEALTNRTEKATKTVIPEDAILKLIEWMPRVKEKPPLGKFVGWTAKILETKRINNTDIFMQVEVRPKYVGRVYDTRYLIEEWELSAEKGLVFIRLAKRVGGIIWEG